MKLPEAKLRLGAVESQLRKSPYVEYATFERDGKRLRVVVTDRFFKAARKARVWRSREMLATLENAAYGFDEHRARSVGGRDGIFLLDDNFRPPNAMMRKLFDRYLDRPGSGVEQVAAWLDCKVENLMPARLVSHHMRLLGVLARREDADWLVLVDIDSAK